MKVCAMRSELGILDAKLEALERRIWEDVRRDWDYVDKIHVQQEDFDALKRVRLSPEELSPVLEALFRPEKRMFLDDIALIVAADEDVRRIIHLKYLDPENAVLSAFDGDGRLFGRIAVHVEGDDVQVKPDSVAPFGLRYVDRFAREYLAKYEPTPDMYQGGRVTNAAVRKLMAQLHVRLSERMLPRLEEFFFFVLAAIHRVLNTPVIVKPAPYSEDASPQEVEALNQRRPAALGPRAPYPRSLQRIIYAGRPAPQKRDGPRVYVQHVESWKVRGHWRVYRTGKRVWVRPHVKGRKSEKFRPLGADYIL